MTEKEKKRLEELRHKKNRTKEELEELNALRKKQHQATFNTPASEKSKKQAEEKGRDTSLKMALASQGITSAPDYQSFGEGYRQAVDRQTQDRIEELEQQKLAIDASLTGMEFISGLYGLGRGVSSANRYLANKAFQKGLLSGTKAAKARLLNQAVNKGQTAMSSVGFVSDVGQAATSEGPWYGDYVNDAELLGDGAGIIGGLNIVRNTPFFGKHRGAIDSVLDGMGYTAAAYDVVHDGRQILDQMATSPVEEQLNQNARGGRLFGQGGPEDIDWNAIRQEIQAGARMAPSDNTKMAPVQTKPLQEGPRMLPEVEVTASLQNVYNSILQKYRQQGLQDVEAAIRARNDLGLSTQDVFRFEHPTASTVGDVLKAAGEGVLLGASFVDPVIGGIGQLGVGAYETGRDYLLGNGAQQGLTRMALASLPGASRTAGSINPLLGNAFDLGTSGYFSAQAADNIYQNGVNPENITNLGLSLLPVTGTAKAQAQRLAQTYGPQAWRTSWYNNLTPGSYAASVSWHPKGKILGEVPQAIKDYFMGKGTEQNPKWLDHLIDPEIWQAYPKGSKYPELEAELRKEAYQVYQGIPHEEKYIKYTGTQDAQGNNQYTIDLNQLPKDLIQEYIDRIQRDYGTNPDYKGAKTGITGDFANIGGHARYENKTDLANDIFRIIQEDVWDVQPFQDPNRIAPFMPKKLRDIMFKEVKNKDGKVTYVHKDWFKRYKDLELGQITGGRPFNVKTTIEGKLKNAYPVRENWTKEKIEEARNYEKQAYEEANLDLYREFFDSEGLTEEEANREWEKIVSDIQKKADEYVKTISDEAIIGRYSTPMTPEEYAESTGVFNYPKSWIPNRKAYGGHLFGTEGQMELAPSNFTNWTEDNWKYNKDYDDLYKNVNWRALNNNLLFHVKDINDVDNILASNNSTFLDSSTIQWLGNMELQDMATGLGLKDYSIDNPVEASALPDTPEAKAFLEAQEKYKNSMDLANRLAPSIQNAADNHLKTTWTLDRETGRMVPKTITKGCLESAQDFGYKMFMYGVPHMRDIYGKFNLADYKNGIYQIPEREGTSDTYSKSNSLSSWNYARALSDAGYGKIVNLGKDIDYTQFPVGTIFNGGHNTSGRLIDPSYTLDENGREYPSHSYMLAGFITDDNGQVKPLLYDYGKLGVNQTIYEPGKVPPTYAFIPNGYEHLTAANLVPRYNEYYNSIHTAPDPALYSLEQANEATSDSQDYLDQINPEELVALNERYGITNAADILQRLVGIASQESEMGYTLDSSSTWNPITGVFDNPFYSGRDYDTWASTYRWMKHSMPDFMKTAYKTMTRPTTPDTEEEIEAKQQKYNKKYDDTPAWKHEIDIYNQLESEGKFEGLSRGEIAKLVAEKYNEARDAWVDEDWWNRSKDNYGKRPPNIRTASQENATNSHGILQMKQWPDDIQYDKEGNEIGRSNVDDAYTGDSEILKGYNRFGYLMQQLKAAYPDLTQDELVDAATIAWNAPSKTKQREFIDFYIKNKNLKDSYLEAVKQHQETLYRDRFRGTKGNYGKGYYRGDDHWYQRVGNWLGTLGYADGGHLYSGEQPGTSQIRVRPTNEVQYVGNTEDQNGEYDPTYVLPNVNVFNVTATLPQRTSADLTPNDRIGFPQGINVTDPDLGAATFGQENYSEMTTPMDFMPFVGDAQDVAGIGRDAAEGNYGTAAIGLGMMAVPNAIEKPLKWVGRKAKPAARRLMTSIGDFFMGNSGVKGEVKESMEDILQKTSHKSMPIGHVDSAYNIKEEIPKQLQEDYQKVMKKVENGEKLTNAEEKILSDYNAFMSSDNHYRPGYQTTNPYELHLGVAPENPRSLTAIALDQNNPYKADGSLADGWVMKNGKPEFDYPEWLKQLDPDSYDYVNVAGDTELNPLSYALYLQKLKGLAAQGKVALQPVRNADGSYFMLRQNNWLASKPEPHYTTQVTVNPDGTKTRTKVKDRDLTVEEKMDKQNRAMRQDSALVQSMRGIMGLPDLPLPARVTGAGSVTDDQFMFPAISAIRVGEDGLPIEPVIEQTEKPSRRRGARFRANGGYLYANGGEPILQDSLSLQERQGITNNVRRGITPQVIYGEGGAIQMKRQLLKDMRQLQSTIDSFRIYYGKERKY